MSTKTKRKPAVRKKKEIVSEENVTKLQDTIEKEIVKTVSVEPEKKKVIFSSYIESIVKDYFEGEKEVANV